jgi:type I restriction enzyme S subunit
VCEEIVDCPHSTPKFVPDGVACIDTNCIKKGRLVTEKIRYVSELDYQRRITRATPRDGDVVFSREGSVGETVVIEQGMKCCLGQRVMLFRPCLMNAFYLQLALTAPSALARLVPHHKGIGARHVNVRDMREFLVPLPPIAEQDRIVDRVRELMAVCDELGAQLVSGDERRAALKRATLREALAS